MLNKFSKIIILTAVAWGLQDARAAALEDSEIRDAAEIAEHIRFGFSPDQAVIIGVGQSPTLPMAVLQTWHDEYAFNVPLSNFRHRLNGRPPAATIVPDLENYRPLDEGERARLFEHLDQFLPSAAATRGRHFVLLDQSESGATLFALAEYLELYLKARGRTEHVDLAVMSTAAYLPDIKSEARRNNRVLYIARLDGDRLFDQKLFAGEYAAISQYGKFNLVNYGDPRAALTARKTSSPAYELLMDELRRRYPRAKRSAGCPSDLDGQ